MVLRIAIGGWHAISRPGTSASDALRACRPSAAALLFNVVAALPSNLNFLNDTPLSYVKPRDMDLIKRALTDVLNTKSEGESSQ